MHDIFVLKFFKSDMATKYYQQHPERSGFADAGLMIAFAVIIVTTLKLWMYGITVVTLAWLAVSLVYIAVAAATKPRNPLRTGFTAFFMVISIVAVYASFQYDYPLSPKRESNIRAEQEEMSNKNDKKDNVQVETPKPVVVETDVVSEDESKFEEVATNYNNDDYPINDSQEYLQDEEDEIELIDLNAENESEISNQENRNEGDIEQSVQQQTTEQFDESFK